ncbi:hypothetical protein L3Y34_012704 [Caenorhabditis briggsae]|uniref:Uncharacterized protein n=1 Tax=Caenorhabditis briggsae TaxID=6238 RepID=A0AAE8ZS32_CAEBR|nr:hypothetical protein L3Y34_012704 [Caenorhabditis briggsae]
MSKNKQETIEWNIQIYKQEAEKMDALVKERFKLLTPPTDYCKAFTNYLAIILCENYITWVPTQNCEEFDFYGKTIQVHQTDVLNELVKARKTTDFEKVTQRLYMKIEAVREMLCVIDITETFDKEFDELLKSNNLEEESHDQPSQENGSPPAYLKPLKAIDAMLNTMEKRAADRLESILTAHRNNWPILDGDGLLALSIEEHLTAAEETLAKWQKKYSGKRVSRYLNAAEYYIKHVIEQLREYFIIASDYECYRKMAIRRTEEETRNKMFIEDTVKADEMVRIEFVPYLTENKPSLGISTDLVLLKAKKTREIGKMILDVEKHLAETFGCTSEKLRAAFEFDTTSDNSPKNDSQVAEQM